MIADLKRYPSMKDSGVPSIGAVPEHWDVTTLGRLGQLFKGNGGSKADEVESGVPCVRYGDLYTRHEFFISQAKACVAPERSGSYTPVEKGDVLFAASGETHEDIGRSAVNLIEGDARCGGDIIVLRPSVAFEPRFLGYAADSQPSRDQKATMGRGFTVVHVYGAQLKHLTLALPPLPEQAAIVRFLDYADRRIRRYIRAKQTLIKLLEEQKQASIHRAVTRGLDPDVRLKPSGVEWLGDVPEHWGLVPNRAVMRLQKHLVGAASSEYTLLSLTKGGVIPRDMDNPEGKFPASFDTYQAVEPGDLIFCLFDIDETPRAVGLSSLHGMITGAYTRFTCDSAVVEWVYLFYLAMDSRKQLKPLYTGLRKVITKSSFLSAKLPLPPDSERREILSTIKEAIGVSDAAAERARTEIALLREYRTRLIADVVTGKLDVRDAAARLPDEMDESESLNEVDTHNDGDEATADDLDLAFEEAEA